MVAGFIPKFDWLHQKKMSSRDYINWVLLKSSIDLFGVDQALVMSTTNEYSQSFAFFSVVTFEGKEIMLANPLARRSNFRRLRLSWRSGAYSHPTPIPSSN
jgi:hypothetical protein